MTTGIEEEEEVFHNAFHKAFDDSKPESLKVPGLQEFAAAIWQRRSNIPSPSSKDPLLHIFDEVRPECFVLPNAGEIGDSFRRAAVLSVSVLIWCSTCEPLACVFSFLTQFHL